MNFLLVGVGASLGAVARYVISQGFAKKFKTIFPLGTLCVNLTGAFLLGILSGLQTPDSLYCFLGVGVMGGYTTFSTFNYELFELLLIKGEKKKFALYFSLSYIFGITFSMLGIMVGSMFLSE